MPSKLKDLLHSLRETSDKINKESDELTTAITSVESALGRFNIGVKVWLSKPIRSEVDEEIGVQFATQLGYAKIDDDKKWFLYLCHTQNGEDCKYVKLLDAKRDDKVLAMERLDGLIEALAKEATEKAQRISSAKAKAEQIVEELGEDIPF